MLELALAIAMIVGMYRLADTDEELSAPLWTGVSVLVVLLCFILPLPFFRVLVAGGLTFGLMFLYKILRKK